MDGWFHVTDKTIEQVMMEQLGPNEIKSSIDHDYFHKRYDSALTTALEFIRVANTNKDCKVSGTKEVSEVAMHCAAKLNRLDVLKDLLNNKSQHSQDTGIYLLRMKFYPLVGQYADAMDACITYHKERKLDYRVWSIMASCFIKSAERDDDRLDMRYHLANLSMVRAIHIYTASRWSTHIDFVKTRFEKELATLKAQLQLTEEKGGNADKFAEWMANGSPDKDKAGLNEFAWEDIAWIMKDWALRQDLDLRDDDVKAVKDL
ncbi:unnamed protein product [Mucor hiemalis]